MCLQIINNQEFGQVRFLQIGNKFYAVASDVAKSLGYDQPHKATSRHCKGGMKHTILTNGGNQEMTIIPEGDIYRLIIRSKLPAAEKFESWVFDEVLPQIRRTGTYKVEPPSPVQRKYYKDRLIMIRHDFDMITGIDTKRHRKFFRMEIFTGGLDWNAMGWDLADKFEKEYNLPPMEYRDIRSALTYFYKIGVYKGLDIINASQEVRDKMDAYFKTKSGFLKSIERQPVKAVAEKINVPLELSINIDMSKIYR